MSRFQTAAHSLNTVQPVRKYWVELTHDASRLRRILCVFSIAQAITATFIDHFAAILPPDFRVAPECG
jgi:hypothetical protein